MGPAHPLSSKQMTSIAQLMTGKTITGVTTDHSKVTIATDAGDFEIMGLSCSGSSCITVHLNGEELYFGED
jgi:hypothetical protein